MVTTGSEPRQHCVAPSLFGKADTINWVRGNSPSERARVAAAHMQHAYCWAIRQHAHERYSSVKTYAREVGLPYERLARVMRGQAPLRFDDVGTARIHLGDIHQTAQRVLTAKVTYANASLTNRSRRTES